MTKQLHLGAFMRPVGIHTAWWRVPGAYPDANFNLTHLTRFIQTLERGRFDAFFMADHLAVLKHADAGAAAERHRDVVRAADPAIRLGHGHRADRPDRHRIDHVRRAVPYRPALRLFGSYQRRAGGLGTWVTTSNPDAALNFGLTEHVDHDERYRRAREFHSVVTGAVG